jgi:hypothetical protein
MTVSRIPLELCSHLAPIPADCIWLYVPFGFHWAVDYWYNVRWFVWVSVLCVLDFVPLWIAQMITGLVLYVNHCALVLFIWCTPRSFVWVSTLCVIYMFVWCSSPRPCTARLNLGVIKKTITHSCACLPNRTYRRDRLVKTRLQQTYGEQYVWNIKS